MKSELRKIKTIKDSTISSDWIRATQPVRAAAVLAHGAGASMDHEFMTYFHEALAGKGISTVKFNFPYMERGRKAPDRPPVLETAFRDVIRAVRTEWAPEHLFIGGKSMGGRMASHLAAQGEPATGLFLLGYPLHPPGKPDRMRREHLASISCPTLFMQGTRDNLCNLDLLRAEISKMQAKVELFIVETGNHSFQVLKKAGRTSEEVRQEMVACLTKWMHSHTK